MPRHFRRDDDLALAGNRQHAQMALLLPRLVERAA